MFRPRKAVIPAGGLGTRFLPVSRSIPKELLPLLERPLIDYALEEVATAGIENVVVVSSPQKPALVDYLMQFSSAHAHRIRAGKVTPGYPHPAVEVIIQEQPLGLGHAVLTAAQAVGDEPFLVLLPDDLMLGQPVATLQLMKVFETRAASVIGVTEVSPEAVRDYGVIKGAPVEDGLYQVEGLVEKPEPQDAPSILGIVGRYVLTPQIFSCLARTPPGAKGEVQLTDALALLVSEQPVYALSLSGTRHDAGTPLGLLKASLDIGMRRNDIREPLIEFAKTILAQSYSSHQ